MHNDFSLATPAVTKVLETAVKETLPKYATIINISFIYEMGGRWHSIDVNFHEYLEILQTATVDGKQICAVEVSVTNCDNEEGDKVKMIYDFVLLNTGRNPWRMS